jgi:hypothetical protein
MSNRNIELLPNYTMLLVTAKMVHFKDTAVITSNSTISKVWFTYPLLGTEIQRGESP